MTQKTGRAYSILTIKSIVSDGDRVIEGIASTPTADRMGDTVDSLGAVFKLPMPLLWQHNHSLPVGEVEFASPTKDGIPFRAKIAKSLTPGVLKDRLDEAWESVKIGLVRAVSIGFAPLEYDVKKEGGLHFKKWEWLELSLVTIPANAEATISVVKSIDTQTRGALAASYKAVKLDNSVGDSTKTKTNKPQITNQKGNEMNLAEQIKAFQAKRATLAARIDAIMAKSAEEGRTLEEAESEEYDNTNAELATVDKHIERLVDLQSKSAAGATRVEGVTSAKSALHVRDGAIITVKSNLPKGTAFARYVQALAMSKGNLMQAAEIAKSRKNWQDTPQVETVLRAAVTAGTTTDSDWAAPLAPYQDMSSEFIELLRPATIMGKLTQLRKVPFDVRMPRQTQGSTAKWVGEGSPKPVSELKFDSLTLRHKKVAGIVVISDELARLSNPNAEALIVSDLTEQIAQLIDVSFVDPAISGTADVRPASITNGVTAVAATGTDADALKADIKSLFAGFLDANQSLASAVLIMSSVQALAISMLQNALGQNEFPDITLDGGNIFGVPVVTSENIPTTTAGTIIILAKQSEILLADDGGVVVDVSREASLEMNDSPTGGAQSLVSLWQNNLMGVRAERWLDWAKRRATAVGYISGANYG